MSDNLLIANLSVTAAGVAVLLALLAFSQPFGTAIASMASAIASMASRMQEQELPRVNPPPVPNVIPLRPPAIPIELLQEVDGASDEEDPPVVGQEVEAEVGAVDHNDNLSIPGLPDPEVDGASDEEDPLVGQEVEAVNDNLSIPGLPRGPCPRPPVVDWAGFWWFLCLRRQVCFSRRAYAITARRNLTRHDGLAMA